MKSEHGTFSTLHFSEILLLFLLVFLLLALKSPDALSNPQFWAEDGTIFFAQQFGHWLPQIFTTYAGYLLFIPRLVAWLAQAFPYREMPLVYNLIAICIDASSIVCFARRTQTFVPTWITIFVFALVPTDGEMFGTLTNVQWFLQFSLFAIALYPRNQKGQFESNRWVLRILAALMALTGPFSILVAVILFVIFALARLHRAFSANRLMQFSSWWRWLDKPIAGIVVACALIQGFALTFIGLRKPKGPFDLELARQVLLNGFQMHTFGDILLRGWLAALLFVLILVLLSRLTYRSRYLALPVMIAMLVFGLAEIVSSVHLDSMSHLVYAGFMDDRYFLFAKVCFWISIACALQHWHVVDRITANAMVPLIMLLIAINHPELLRRKPLPDLHWKQSAKELTHADATTTITIPINPSPWKITVAPGPPHDP